MMGEDKQLQAPGCSAQFGSWKEACGAVLQGLGPVCRPSARRRLSGDQNAENEEHRRGAVSEPLGLVPLTLAILRGALDIASILSVGQSVQPRLGLDFRGPKASSVTAGRLEPDLTSPWRKGEAERGVVTSSQDGGESGETVIPVGLL